MTPLSDLIARVEGLREQIARIVDPEAYADFPIGGDEPGHDWMDREQALAKADAILSLLKALAAKDPS